MAGDSVTFRLDGEVTMSKLADAFNRFARVLDELPRAHDAHIRWVLADLEYSSAIATARAVPLDEASATFVPVVVEEFLEAARGVARGEVNENRPVLRLVRDLTEIADEHNPMILETAEDEVVFSAPIPAAPTSAAGPQSTKSLGTVRGRVETLSHRKHLRFTLYELATDKAVGCYLNPDDEEQMRDAWGRVADVTGLITRDTQTGRPLNVRHVTSVQIVEEGTPDGYLRARGAVGGTEPAEKVIRRIRDAS